MDLVSGYKGVVGLVFGNDGSALSEDSYIERLLDRISNGSLTEDRRTAIVELQSVVVENHAAQLAFGAMGFPVIMGVLKEEREDIDMVRGALETLVGALTPIDHARGPKNDIQPALMNSDLLSREVENISLLLSLLSEDDFYVRYYTLQLLTALLTNSPNRLQEAILTIPRGITRLMDMLMDREVIRNEALLLLTYLTREAEEIQKIVVFEGAFEKLFSIIKEEGGPDGGVVVQDCLQLLNNLLRNNTSNQILLRETMGFDPLISILKLRGNAYKLTQQKTINLLSALETISFLIMGTEPGKDTVTNKTVLVQRNVLDHLLMLGVESQWAPVAVRCAALRCIGDLISRHPKNRDVLLSKFLGEEPQVEPALNSVLRIILRSSSMQDFIAADYVFKSFCEKNADGQTMLGSTLVPQPHASHDEDVSMSFGSMLLRGLTLNENDGDLEMCCRAASVLTHVLKDNIKCKERVLGIELEAPMGSLGAAEPLLHCIVKYLALASSMKNKDGKSSAAPDSSYAEPIILKLLVTWLSDCPSAVHCFLDAQPQLTFTLELVSNPSTPEHISGLAAIILGECILYNKSTENGRDAFAVVDAITQKIGLASYFKKFDGIGDVGEKDSPDQKKDEDPILTSILDAPFFDLVKRLEAGVRENVVDVYSQPKSNVSVVPAELEQKSEESDADYIKRLKSFVEQQCSEMQSLLSRNATLAEDMAMTGNGRRSQPEQSSGSGVSERIQAETLRRDLQEARQRIETLKAEKSRIESEALTHKTLAEKMESELQSLSGAYNSLEQANFALETQVKALRSKGPSPGSPDLEAIRAEAREEALKESEGELSDLLVCLGQEQSKVERLSVRLIELGEDVEDLLQGIGDEDDAAALPQYSEEEDE